eukprot:IDg13482t1
MTRPLTRTALFALLLCVFAFQVAAQKNASQLLEELESFGFAEAGAPAKHGAPLVASARTKNGTKRFSATAAAANGRGSTHASLSLARRNVVRQVAAPRVALREISPPSAAEENRGKDQATHYADCKLRFATGYRCRGQRAWWGTARIAPSGAKVRTKSEHDALRAAEHAAAARPEKTLRSKAARSDAARSDAMINTVTAVELAEARQRLGLASARSAGADATLLEVGGPPGPVTMAERWRSKSTRAGEDCWRAVRTGYLCIDDYAAHAIVCNPRVTYRASLGECTQ